MLRTVPTAFLWPAAHRLCGPRSLKLPVAALDMRVESQEDGSTRSSPWMSQSLLFVCVRTAPLLRVQPNCSGGLSRLPCQRHGLSILWSAWSPGHVAFRGASSHFIFEKEICTRILLHTCELGVPWYYGIVSEGLVVVLKFWCHGANIPKTSPV